MISHELTVAKLKATLVAGFDPTADFVPPPGATPAHIELQRNLLTNAVLEQRAKLADLDRQIGEAQGNRDAVAASVAKIDAELPIERQRVGAYESLRKTQDVPFVQYLQTKQEFVEDQHELKVQQARLVEANQKLAALTQQRRQADAEFRRKTLSDLTDAETKAASLHDELLKAQEHRRLDTLTAPVDGTVQQLAVHTVGGVVTPAQQLLVVVPADSRLEVEAMVKNQDIGFVHAGEKAEIKVDTFNFTKYGLLHGSVESVSRDAIARNKPTDNGGSDAKSVGATDETSEPAGQELVYAARVSLDRTQMNIDGKMVALEPGMAVTAEIKTGKRRVIQYVLSPLLRYKQDALRER